jgi:SPP1 family predicted phage head-tail adaptor
MKAGPMDRRVTILVYSKSRDAAGGPVETWTEGDTVWAQKVDQTGREFQAAAQTNAQMTTRFWLRWRPDITAKDRLRLIGEGGAADVEYDITQPPREVGRREGLEITAQGRV